MSKREIIPPSIPQSTEVTEIEKYAMELYKRRGAPRIDTGEHTAVYPALDVEEDSGKYNVPWYYEKSPIVQAVLLTASGACLILMFYVNRAWSAL